MKKKNQKIIRVGILGLGRAGHTMHLEELEAFPDNYLAVAGCDKDPERRREAREAYPALRIYANAKDLLADPEVDMIAVATRSPDHVRHSIRALEAGKYVVCEKPVAASVHEIEKLKAAGERFPGKLFIRHNRRFESAFAHVREIIASGKLGFIYEIKLRRHSYQWRCDWQTIRKGMGGQLLNWGPHLIDQALQFLEAPVESIWSDLKLVAAYGDAEDHFKLLLRGTNARIVDVEVSGGVPLPENVYCIHGTRGTLISADEKTIKMRYLRTDKKIPEFTATTANPPLHDGFGNAVPADWWVEEEVPVAPASGDTVDMCYLRIWEAIMGIRPYAVTIDQAIEVVRVTERVRRTKIDDIKHRS